MASDARGSLSFEYFAFISYSRKDSHVAGWLQRKLEWYRFPTDLVESGESSTHPTYVRPVVRNMTDLEVESNSFWEDIRSKLDRSRFLIVLCSPNAAKSAYVDREIRHFLHDSRRPSALQQVVPLIVAGQPGTADETECLPAVLQGLKDQILERNLPTMLPDAGQRDREGWENGLIKPWRICFRWIGPRSPTGTSESNGGRSNGSASAGLRRAVIACLALLAWIGWDNEADLAVNEETLAIKEKGLRLDAERQLAVSTLDRGLSLCKQGQIGHGMLWMTRCLEIAPSDMNDLHWFVRSSLAEWSRWLSPRISTFLQGEEIAAVAFASHGKVVATRSPHDVKLWDAAAGGVIASLGNGQPVECMSFSPDGKLFVTAGGTEDKGGSLNYGITPLVNP